METELTVQSERAFQKQPHIFLNHKSKTTKSRSAGKGGRRWFKDVGLGFRTPKTAIEGSYIGELDPGAGMRRTVLSIEKEALHSTKNAYKKLTCFTYRQEMPFHRPCIYPWPYSYRKSRFYQDASHIDHTPRVPPLHSQVCQIREETRQPCRTCLPCLPC